MKNTAAENIINTIGKELFSDFINGEVPIPLRFEKFFELDGGVYIDKDICRAMVSEKLWEDIACYVNFADISKFEFMLTLLPLLGDPLIYPGYQKHVASMTAELKDFSKFKKNCKRLFHINANKEVYNSVLAYMLSTMPKARPMLEALFKKNEGTVLKHASNRYASRDYARYNLDIAGYHNYRMALMLCLEAESDARLKAQIREIIRKAIPEVNEYVEKMGQYLKKEDYADGFFGPFLFVLQKVYAMHGDINLILRLILSIYELCQDKGYPVHDDEPMFVTGLFFLSNSTNDSITSTGANIIISRCKDAIKAVSGMRFENEFISFLSLSAFLLNWNGHYVEGDTNYIIERLKLLPKKRIKGIVEGFITSKYILSSTDYDGYENCTDYVKQNLKPALDFFQYAYNEWYRQYKGLKEDYGDESREAEPEIEDARRLALFLNMFVDHARLELHLSDISQADIPFGDIEKEERVKVESEYKQKYIDLEKECRNLRSDDTNKKALMAENAELKKKIAELNNRTSQHTDEREKDKKELVGLRNLVHELSGSLQPEETQSKVSLEEMGEYLNKNVKGIIIGGHVNVHNKLDKYIPKWKKYAPETKITLNAIKNNDIVVMFSDYLNHSSYFGAIDCIRESDCKLLYVHNVNMEYVMSKIYNTCKEELS